MLRKEKEGIHWLEFELFAEFPKLKAAVVLRRGGCSSGFYESLNLNYQVGDDPNCVAANHKKISETLGFLAPIWGNQVHKCDLAYIATHRPPEMPCDGLLTSLTHLSLLIHHADCQAAIFYDPVHHALSAVHCGWRGNVGNIYGATVSKMQVQFGTDPTDLFVAISPSLGPEKGEFRHYQTELPQSFWSFQTKPTYFDLWAISEWQLQQAGLLPHHIQIARIDTYANADDYFSYRRDKIRGGNGTLAMLL